MGAKRKGQRERVMSPEALPLARVWAGVKPSGRVSAGVMTAQIPKQREKRLSREAQPLALSPRFKRRLPFAAYSLLPSLRIPPMTAQ